MMKQHHKVKVIDLADAKFKLNSIKQAVATLGRLDDESRKAAINQILRDGKALYAEMCTDYRLHYNMHKAYVEPKAEIRQLLDELRERKKRETND